MAAQAPSPPGTNDTHVVSFPDSDKPKPRPNYFPRSVPRDFGQRLVKVHGDPFAWWMGQFFKYAMRMTEGFQEYVEKLGARLGFESPIVGIQVRRTDKLRHDSRFIELEEYMEVVDDFFDDLEVRGTNVTTRRIYLATDDPGVLQEAKKFPNYKFVFNEDSVASASLGRRGSVDNMKYLMADILFLSRSDFLVCGMSSNICRLAYELMQTLHSDATRKLVSLDLPFCIHGQTAQEVEARFPHTPRSTVTANTEGAFPFHPEKALTLTFSFLSSLSGREIALQKGDRVVRSVHYYSRHRNYHDGFWHGTNLRTGKSGFYPIYKTFEVQSLADTPSFDWIDRREEQLGLDLRKNFK
ncbi:Alpha-(1,6)-fucosyltransferase [Penaeus vannamei]|uniref:Alpha-(1,6)-fucosyltransferase n=1 Tax=Penaeus vannamei TaxID=6689 RepID=A0A423SHJ5_PENVA|nr:Alpha-(1,6)-fucosyltransferase [Penaeus vannamei]